MPRKTAAAASLTSETPEKMFDALDDRLAPPSETQILTEPDVATQHSRRQLAQLIKQKYPDTQTVLNLSPAHLNRKLCPKFPDAPDALFLGVKNTVARLVFCDNLTTRCEKKHLERILNDGIDFITNSLLKYFKGQEMAQEILVDRYKNPGKPLQADLRVGVPATGKASTGIYCKYNILPDGKFHVYIGKATKGKGNFTNRHSTYKSTYKNFKNQKRNAEGRKQWTKQDEWYELDGDINLDEIKPMWLVLPMKPAAGKELDEGDVAWLEASLMELFHAADGSLIFDENRTEFNKLRIPGVIGTNRDEPLAPAWKNLTADQKRDKIYACYAAMMSPEGQRVYVAYDSEGYTWSIVLYQFSDEKNEKIDLPPRAFITPTTDAKNAMTKYRETHLHARLLFQTDGKFHLYREEDEHTIAGEFQGAFDGLSATQALCQHVQIMTLFEPEGGSPYLNPHREKINLIIKRANEMNKFNATKNKHFNQNLNNYFSVPQSEKLIAATWSAPQSISVPKSGKNKDSTLRLPLVQILKPFILDSRDGLGRHRIKVNAKHLAKRPDWSLDPNLPPSGKKPSGAQPTSSNPKDWKVTCFIQAFEPYTVYFWDKAQSELLPHANLSELFDENSLDNFKAEIDYVQNAMEKCWTIYNQANAVQSPSTTSASTSTAVASSSQVRTPHPLTSPPKKKKRIPEPVTENSENLSDKKLKKAKF